MPFLIEPHVADIDNTALLDLWSRNLPEVGAAREEWLYRTGVARSWLLRNDDGSPIGSAGLMQRRFRYGDDVFTAGQAIDLNVDAAFRSVGPALALQRQLAGELGATASGFLYGDPSPQAAGVLKRVGYKSVGDFERWVKPLRSYSKMTAYLPSKALARAASPLVDVGLKLRSRDIWLRLPSRLAVEHPTCFDERFDRLWNHAKTQFPIAGERHADYLQWRFVDHPEHDFKILALVAADSRELLGYVVSLASDDGLTISDVLYRDTESLDWLLTAFIKYARAQRAEAIEMVYLGGAPLPDRLQAFGFYRRPFARQLLVLPEKSATALDLLDKNNWYYTKADSDIDV